uniref:Uncharacterized protein n=1 Tax=Oryza glumipatula TaxID=40148 RepID=A0A0E0BBK0_9ORYZ
MGFDPAAPWLPRPPTGPELRAQVRLPLVAADLASSGGGWPLMDLGRWGATVAADLASGNVTTTAAVSGDDDHGEMGIWGCRPDEATRGAPTPPMRGFCSWLRGSRAQARRLTRFFCWLGFAL